MEMDSLNLYDYEINIVSTMKGQMYSLYLQSEADTLLDIEMLDPELACLLLSQQFVDS